MELSQEPCWRGWTANVVKAWKQEAALLPCIQAHRPNMASS